MRRRRIVAFLAVIAPCVAMPASCLTLIMLALLVIAGGTLLAAVGEIQAWRQTRAH